MEDETFPPELIEVRVCRDDDGSIATHHVDGVKCLYSQIKDKYPFVIWGRAVSLENQIFWHPLFERWCNSMIRCLQYLQRQHQKSKWKDAAPKKEAGWWFRCPSKLLAVL